jgi:hypothetical protein
LVFTVVGIGIGHAQDTDDWPYWFIVLDAILFIVIYQLAKRAKKLEAFATGGKNITRLAIGLTVIGFVLLLLYWNVQILNLLILMMIQIGALLWVSFRNSQTLESSYDITETKENDWINWAIKLIYFNHVTNLEKTSKKKDQTYFFYTERNIFIGYQTTALIATLSYFAIIFFIPIGRSVGSFVFVLLAFGILLGVGNILTFLSFKSKTNWHFIVIAIIAIAGFLVEPHWVRTIKLDQINSYKQRPDLKSYLEKWVNDPIRANMLAQNSVTTFPVFFILADGGASRSGYWAASLLSGLHDSTRIKGQTASFFQQHLLGLAGASGGSVGNISFVTALSAQHKDPSLLTHELCTNFLKADFLTHPLARLLGPEFIKSVFNPFWGDRAQALEATIEHPEPNNESSKIMAGMMAGNIDQLFINNDFTPPIICVNTTRMQDGKPGIVSNIKDSIFNSRVDVLGQLNPKQGLRISTTVVLGARFPYLSPAGRIQNNYFVDGGYFDNSGAGPIIEIINGIQTLSSNLNQDLFLTKALKKLTFHVIHIQNTPLKKEKMGKVHPFANDLAAPLITLIGSYGTQTGFNDSRLINLLKRTKIGSYAEVNLYKNPTDDFPMSWVISSKALNQMDTVMKKEKFVTQFSKQLIKGNFKNLNFYNHK